MARSEPNMRSQKCGKGCAGAESSTVMVSDGAVSAALAWARAAADKSVAESTVPSRKAPAGATQRDLDGVLKAALRAEGRLHESGEVWQPCAHPRETNLFQKLKRAWNSMTRPSKPSVPLPKFESWTTLLPLRKPKGALFSFLKALKN